ncbi:hypothetical protein F5B18DRAFT_139597 [Nemania serpens]|nr:hypothetical protein F5B18DRAFT_139597 [Nemania serpens]
MGSEEPLSLDQTRGTKGGKGGTLSRFLVSSPLPRPLYPGIRSFFSRHAANMGSVYPLGRPDMQASIRPTTARYQPLPFQATYSSRQACSGDHWNGSPCSDPCRKRPPLFAQARAGPENLPGWTDGLANGTWYGYFYGCLPDERPLIGIYVVPYPHDIWPSILSRSRARGPIGCQSRLSVPLFDAEVRKGSSAYHHIRFAGRRVKSCAQSSSDVVCRRLVPEFRIRWACVGIGIWIALIHSSPPPRGGANSMITEDRQIRCSWPVRC